MIWALAAAVAVLVLVLLTAEIASRTRRGADALDRLAHAWAEGAWRLSGTWSDFAHWVRTGR